MGLRLDGAAGRRRRRALRQLWEAGEVGIAVLIASNVGVLIKYGMAEEYIDTTRVLIARYRLTWEGQQLCRQLFAPLGFYPTKEK